MLIIGQARAQQLAGPLSAVAIDERELFNTVAYYGRDYFGQDGPPPESLARRPLPAEPGGTGGAADPRRRRQVLAVSRDGARIVPMRAQFQSVGETELATVLADRKHQLTLQMFVGQGFVGAKR